MLVRVPACSEIPPLAVQDNAQLADRGLDPAQIATRSLIRGEAIDVRSRHFRP